MITADSGAKPYMTSFSNGEHTACADNTVEKGGGGAGFRPHELLEAALASCMNMWLRMYADNHRLPLERVVTKVQLNRAKPDEPSFEYEIALDGPLTVEQRGKLRDISHTCPVRKTLAGTLSFSCLNTEGAWTAENGRPRKGA